MVTTRLKTNPYNVVGVATEPNAMTMGQRLAMKHTISEPTKNKASTTNRQSYEIKRPPCLSGKTRQKVKLFLCKT